MGALLLDVHGIKDSEGFLVEMLLNIEVSFLLVFATLLWVGLLQEARKNTCLIASAHPWRSAAWGFR